MATSTFERKIEINDPASLEKLAKIMNDKTPGNPIKQSADSRVSRDRSEGLLKRCPLRSPR